MIGLVVMIVCTVILILCANPLYNSLSKIGRVQGTESIYTPGTYTAAADGFGGPVTVTVTVDDKNIEDLSVDAPDEDEAIGGAAAAQLRSDILKNQTADIDGVSGATFTSNAVLEAAKAAIYEARGN